ncbi:MULTISPECIES: D-ribose pyranase [Pseudothermotoga]|uniref:D-ribose pyranase n=1 Tax=Pseudothermotoga lettingae (strain ATCC BAA-301 / DSM 14385 / NBRC 107922 / TMO) TaxID=416591 RepID=RBSD_PSELT|nr:MULTISPECIES: D-ribose pyranase [Pseudothermotoga]A8F3M5.1 RecName: Full=D-ribose pyranase [Pseudothermotoga lettingae TMO]ABV32759.1 RbsD or FucU transport [Pseudothermotoga lettingae TMO]KUK21002.1 MAG: D-ribose pyranase [Pseudothermotoga lettingae]MDI3495265.1 D-ribose pyranase [Pseudothermotoga sp.]MDK2885232.1 D-ribose pyranase [Pseudothermotoga sp.]GLI48247.1 D-ribose pyranase [Pseudothermotoga lettingae TMO]
MKKNGILNRELSYLIASMGHGDILSIVDSGFPISEDVFCVDLSLIAGKPKIVEIIIPLLEELEIEKVLIAEEIKMISPKYHQKLLSIFPKNVQIEYIPHEKFKDRVRESKGVVRTGEQTSYSSVILVGGVTYHGEKEEGL